MAKYQNYPCLGGRSLPAQSSSRFQILSPLASAGHGCHERYTRRSKCAILPPPFGGFRDGLEESFLSLSPPSLPFLSSPCLNRLKAFPILNMVLAEGEERALFF